MDLESEDLSLEVLDVVGILSVEHLVVDEDLLVLECILFLEELKILTCVNSGLRFRNSSFWSVQSMCGEFVHCLEGVFPSRRRSG